MSRFYVLQRHAIYVLIAAALFGASAPLAKQLLEHQSPLSLAALAYLGGGIALGLTWLLRRRRMKVPRAHSNWTTAELANLMGAIAAGGVLAPIILFWSLSRMPAASASLLLTFEGLLTAVFAAALFHEAVARRVWLAMLMMIIAGAILSLDGEFALQFVPATGVVLACALWGLDNNLTRAVSHRDALGIAALKGVVAGSTNAAVAWLLGHHLLVSVQGTLGALTLGVFSYGLSLVLFVGALAHLGSARTAAHFGTAPFVGAVLAVLLGEPLSLALIAAVLLTLLSTWLVLTETHEHRHTHEALEHEHMHVHDEHHQHAHAGDEGPEPHLHSHEHEPLPHSHAHLPDLHHRHRH